MKKLAIIILLAALLCSMAGCADKTVESTVTAPTGASQETSIDNAVTNEPALSTDPAKDSDLLSSAVDVSDLTGPWHLDTYRNDISGFSTLFEAYAEFGASMEIRSSGQMSWYIGVEGGDGTYSVNGTLLTADLSRTVDESPMTTEFDILRDGDEIYLGMHWTNGMVFWSWGDDDSADPAGVDTSLYPGKEVVELVNLRGDETTAYKLDDGRYMDRAGIVYIYDGVETWTDENGADWNESVN